MSEVMDEWFDAVNVAERRVAELEAELRAAVVAADDALRLAESAYGLAENASSEFADLVDRFFMMSELMVGWRRAAMSFFDHHEGVGENVYRRQCVCDRCDGVRRMLSFQATSSMVE